MAKFTVTLNAEVKGDDATLRQERHTSRANWKDSPVLNEKRRTRRAWASCRECRIHCCFFPCTLAAVLEKNARANMTGPC